MRALPRPGPWAGVAVALGVTVVAWLEGVSLAQSVVLGTAASAAIPLLTLPRSRANDLPLVSDDQRHGSRPGVLLLAWEMATQRAEARESIVGRLRSVAGLRLSEVGIELDDPAQAAAAEGLLGPTAYRILTTATPTRIAPSADVTRCIEAVERLTSSREAGGLSPANSSLGRRRTRYVRW